MPRLDIAPVVRMAGALAPIGANTALRTAPGMEKGERPLELSPGTMRKLSRLYLGEGADSSC